MFFEIILFSMNEKCAFKEHRKCERDKFQI